ncbi:hypothetical protein BDV12DRAFT_203057 [Aspergillus spectabilis]
MLEFVHESSVFNPIEWITSPASPLMAEEIKITEDYNAHQLRDAVARGELSATKVCLAFMKRAALAQQLTNCATEIFFEEGLKRAKELDEMFQQTGKTVGSLHGLPISVKDCFLVQGQYSTLGLVAYLDHERDTRNSPLVNILLEEGAVIYMKTNVPQTMMAMETDNRVFGRTLNPHNLSLTAGGSSGGEGALVGLGGSILGIGTDIGGSIRIPALCNGIYGFKPTVGRVPYGEQKSCSREGTPGLLTAAGPLARTASDLTLLCKAVMASKRPWENDAEARGGGWRDVTLEKTLRIGVWMGEQDGEYALTAPINRALKSAAKSLEDAQHKVIILSRFLPVGDTLKLAADYFQLDDQETLKHIIRQGNEEPIAALANTAPQSVTGSKKYHLSDVWDCNRRLKAYREIMRQIWKENRLDVVICPPSTTIATPHDKFPMPAYAIIWNLLDFPASVIPYLKTDDVKDREYGNYLEAIPPVDKMPMGIQIVGWRGDDEFLLNATTEIDRVLSTALY